MMLYHLCKSNVNGDISLHVSANNPAMVSLLTLDGDCNAKMLVSFCTRNLVSRQKSLLRGFMKIIWTPIPMHAKTACS